MTKPKPKCPECAATFATVQVLAMHRKNMHGVEGTSKSTAALHKLKARKRAEAEAAKLAEQSATLSTLATVVAAAEHRGQQPQTCSICGFVAKNVRGMTVHIATKHRQVSSEQQQQPPQQEKTPTTGGNELEYVDKKQRSLERRTASQAKREREAASDGIPEATLALALGRFQGLCASMALEFDLPPRRFAARLAELIFATQIR